MLVKYTTYDIRHHVSTKARSKFFTGGLLEMFRFIRSYSKKLRLNKSKGRSPVKPTIKANIPKLSKTYIPFSKFPKVPEEVEKQALLFDFNYSQLKNKAVDYEIPKQFTKSYMQSKLSNKDKALLEQLNKLMNSNDEGEILQSQSNFAKIYYDKDSFVEKGAPEHPLRGSITGMFNLNPSLADITDEYLWEIVPENKLFGQVFDLKLNIVGKEQQDAESSTTKASSQRELFIKEINDFLIKFNKTKSFYHTVNGRVKLNKKLVKEYKKLNLEQKLAMLEGDTIHLGEIDGEMNDVDLKNKRRGDKG